MTPDLPPNLPPDLPYDAFTQALTSLTEASVKALPHGILPWTAFPEEGEPPDTITKDMWNAYTWNPPQFAAEALPETYGAEDTDASDKPAWDTIAGQATRQACSDARDIKLKDLAANLATRTTFPHAGHTWQGDTDSAADITTAALRATQADTWPENFVWINAANTHVPMQAADMITLAQALAAWRNARRIHARTLKDAITEATTAQAIAAIDVTTGWPDQRENAE